MSTARILRRGAAWIAVLAVLAAGSSDRLALDAPGEAVRHAGRRLGRRLRERHGLVALVAFDEAEVREWAHNAPVTLREAGRVPGRWGDARAFGGHRDSFVSTPAPWEALGTDYSITAWVRLERGGIRQAIVYSRAGHPGGLLLLEDRMVFIVPRPDGTPQTVSYPFERYGEFVHLAAVADGAAGRARLHEDGRLMAEIPLEGVSRPSGYIEFGKHNPTRAEAPLNGVLDETAVWSRALSPAEVGALARLDRPLLRALEPFRFWAYGRAAVLRDGVRGILRGADLLSPFHHVSHIGDSGLPEWNLVLSRADLRHFNRALRRCRENHYPAPGTGRSRGVEVLWPLSTGEGEGAPARTEALRAGLRLFAGAPGHWAGLRASYVLDLRGREHEGMGRVLLVPFENDNVFGPLFEQRAAARLGIPVPRAGLVRLNVNGGFQGVYYFEDHTRPGFPGSLAAAAGPRPLSPAAMLSRAEALSLYDELAREWRGSVLNDIRSGLSRREIRRRIRGERGRVGERAGAGSPLDAFAEGLDAAWLRGGNLSAWHVTGPLRLGVRPPPGLSLEWESDDPEWIRPDGSVTRPADGAPRRARLRARISGEGREVERALEFRVMPVDPGVPAVALWCAEPVDLYGRAAVRLEGLPPGPLDGKGLMDGGARYRGNTVLLNRKRSYSIRMEEPHGIFGEDRGRHVYLQAVPPDRTVMRNRLAYDLFRSLGDGGDPRFSPRVEQVELFVNGDYRGLYEMSQRADRFLVGFDRHRPGEPFPAVLYNAQGAGANFRRRSPLSYRQRMPPPGDGAHWGPYEDLIRWVGEEPAEAFRRLAPRRIHYENVMDFAFVLNLSNNGDGANRNLYIARDRGPDSRFFLVPWDYDRSFGNETDRWLSNGLIDRLLAEDPGFRAGFRARWARHRAGPLSEDRILEHVDRMAERLAPFAPWNIERWDTPDRDFDALVDAKRKWILERLRFLDARIEAL